MAGFTRDEMDKWALRSHQLAAKAQKEGFFKGEIKLQDGSRQMYDYDACVRADTTMEALSQLKLALMLNGCEVLFQCPGFIDTLEYIGVRCTRECCVLLTGAGGICH